MESRERFQNSPDSPHSPDSLLKRMPKIKLKPHLEGIEIGIGNRVNIKLGPGEAKEVTEDLLAELLPLGHFEIAEDDKPKKGNE